MLKTDRDVVVLGGGVIGLSIAYYCSKKGHRVTVVDRNPAARDGCSFGNAGMVVPSHFVPLAAPGMVALGLKWMWNSESPFYIKPRLSWDLLTWAYRFWRAANPEHVRRSAPLLRDLSFASRAAFEELAEGRDHDFGWVKKGLLMLCKTEAALEDEAALAEKARSLGVPAEVLDQKQTASRDPKVTMDVAGAVYFPKDCHLSPQRFMAMLQRELDRAGVKFLWQTEATDFRYDDSRIRGIHLSTGEIEADEIVLCGGSWSPNLARKLGLRLPMQAGKGYSLTVAHPPQLPDICAIFTEARVAVTPMGQALRFGGTMEIAGLNEDINPRRVQGIIKSAAQYYPAFPAEAFAGISPWRGLRPCSPDGLPYLGRTAKYANLTIATGHGMMGLSLGPITGKLVAEIISGEKPSIDIDQLHPDR